MLNTERLKNLRKNTNYKQVDVANILGVGRTTYAKYESGDIQPPNDQIIKLSNLFKVTSDYLLNLSDNPTSPNVKKTDSETITIKKENYTKISDRLTNLRLKNKLSQSQLAEKTDLTKAIISKYESDDIEPDITILKIFAEYYNVSLAYLTCETSNPTISDGKSENEQSVRWKDIRVTFYEGGEGEDLDDEDKEEILELVKFAREHRRKKREEKEKNSREH